MDHLGCFQMQVGWLILLKLMWMDSLSDIYILPQVQYLIEKVHVALSLPFLSDQQVGYWLHLLTSHVFELAFSCDVVVINWFF